MSIHELLGIGPVTSGGTSSPIRFSLMFFSDTRADVPPADKYGFVRDLTLFGDQEGFEAVYLPERHFHEFGAIFPNPALMAASLIPQTKHIRFRTAGISLPLHHPAEVVEWWAMNDVLSGGRVDLGFGSGWHKSDFIYAPENYARRREIMSERIKTVECLWNRERMRFPGPGGEEAEIAVYPRPVQRKLNVWVLVAQNDEGFVYAGEQGYNVFTMLFGNDLEAMRAKVKLYREARRRAGHDPSTGVVSLMLHTLIGENLQQVRERVKAPFTDYVRSSMGAHLQAGLPKAAGATFDAGQHEQILEYAVERYLTSAALFGSVEDGARMVDHAIDVGVNDIACLMDFGVDYRVVKDSLPYLKRLRAMYR